MKKKTIGNSPFDTIIPSQETEPKQQKKPKPKKETAPVAQKPHKTGKERLTVHLSSNLIDRAKNAVYWTPGLTLSGLAEDAFSYVLKTLERENGESFKARLEELTGGRPLK